MDSGYFRQADLSFIESLNTEVDRIDLIEVNQREPQHSQFGQHFSEVRTYCSNANDGYGTLVNGILIDNSGVSKIELLNPRSRYL